MVSDKEFQDLLHHEKGGDLRLFDQQLGDVAASFVAHIRRCYQHLAEIIASAQPTGREHWSLATLYLWDATTSLAAAYQTLRQGYPSHALDLGRRSVESTSVAVWICDHPKSAFDKNFTKIRPSACVSYAKRHMPNVGRSYGFFSLFDHAHSALLVPFRLASDPAKAGYQLGPLSIADRPGLFRLAALRLLAASHNLEGVVEMLLYRGLRGERRFWVDKGTHLDYRPIAEEQECEKKTATLLEKANQLFEAELMPRFGQTAKK